MNFVFNKKIIYLAIAVVGVLLFMRPLEIKAAVSGKGLIGYWTMDDNDFFGSTMFDRSGFNIHMSANGNYSTSTPGKKRQARNTGASKADYFQSIVNDPYVNPELGKGSVFAWVRTTSSTSRQAIFSDEGWIILEMVTGTIYCGTTGSDSQRAFYDQLTITDGQWHMVGCTWILNTFTRVYIDGKQKSSNGFSNPQLTSTAGRKATIGREIYQVTNGGHFDGDIDEVRLYNRVLTSGEVDQLYNSRAVTTISAQPTKQLLAHWTMDNYDINGSTIYDKSGLVNNLSSRPQAATTTIGKLRQAMTFDGANGYASSTFVFTPRTNSLTVSAWVRPRTYSASGSSTIMAADDGNPVWGCRIDNTTKKLSMFVRDNSAVIIDAISTSTIQASRWTHIACVWDLANERATSYIDGRLENQITKTSIDSTTIAQYVNLVGLSSNNGAPYTSQADYFNGEVDDLRVYSYALSKTEVQQIYNASGLSMAKSSILSSLIGHWTMDNGDIRHNQGSSTIFDASGFKNNLITFPQKATSTVGKLRQALTFDGKNGYASSTSVFTPRSNSLTVSSWVRPRSYTASGSSTIMAADDGNSVWGCRIDNTSNKLTLFVRDNALVTIDAISTSTLQASKWYHIACVWDVANERATTYINGRLENQITKTSIDSTTIAQYLNLVGLSSNNGAPYTSQGDYFNGEMDDLRVYSYALSKLEVQQIYNAARTLQIK